MDEPSATLRFEHDAIQVLLSVLDGMAHRLRVNEAVPREDLDDAMTVVVEFADRCHHAKEEQVVFPALRKASPEIGADIARRLTSDHQAFRKLVRAMRDLCPKARTRKSARVQLAKYFSTYIRVLREHIRIEEEQLLPEVDRSLAPAQRAEFAERFDRVEAEEIGWGMHEAYHAMIHRLAESYAPAPTPA